MEINRVSNAGVNLSIESHQAPNKPVPTPAPEQEAASKPMEPRLESLQQAMRELPDVEHDKVVAIRQAIANGEISTDPATLAKLMISYHRGSDV